MTGFEPIAVVGASCLVPGAASPQELWQRVVSGDDLLSDPPEGHWRLDPRVMLAQGGADRADRVVSLRGGYVRDFETLFDPAEVNGEGLDPLFHWVFWCAREALRQAGHDPSRSASRVGLIMGNLGYPSTGMSRYAEAVWLGSPTPDPRNRFHFGSAAAWAAKSLKLDLGGFSVDAACAASLYAIKLASDQLHDRRADLMIAGGVNRADDLFLHAGFTALGALSPTGRSLPFHRQADGLVPAEGAAFVALKRLESAITSQDRILGIIRGIGLTNDGRAGGMLQPAVTGQVSAMRAAYEMASLSPVDISLVECHATGTPVGDGIEVESLGAIFTANDGLTIGSIKSNLGHPITAAGAIGLIKVLEALRSGVLPPPGARTIRRQR